MERTKIFVSWSGALSHAIASTIAEWLPTVVSTAEPFISSKDLKSGSKWMQTLLEQLGESQFAILCLTSENMDAPWILFEAGAVAKGFESTHVVPLLIDLKVKDMKDPLRQLNAVALTREQMFKLVEEINQLSNDPDKHGVLKKRFESLWNDLNDRLAAIRADPAHAGPRRKYDVFLSAPMAAYSTDKKYKAERAIVEKVFHTLRDECKLQVYWAAEQIHSKKDFTTLDISIDLDLRAIRDSKTFMLLYPAKLASSVLFEAGYALALGLRSHYFVSTRDNLPFLMRELPGRDREVTIHDAHDWKDYNELCRRLVQNCSSWFPPK